MEKLSGKEYSQLVGILSKIPNKHLFNKLPKHYSSELKNLCVQLLKAYPAERLDINGVFNKYKIFGNKFDINKNINITGNNTWTEEKIIKNINNINIKENKFNFKSICSKYIKFGSDRKIINKKNNNINQIDVNKNNDENLKISIYENIKDKINDPYNIINNKINQNTFSNCFIISNNKNNVEQNDITN